MSDTEYSYPPDYSVLRNKLNLRDASELDVFERRRVMQRATSSAQEAFYSTLCHELVHWSGAKGRLNRDLSGRFASDSYAAEELVAELGAAFLCSDLGITAETRADHTH